MKFNVTEEEWAGHSAAVRRGAIEGTLAGVAIATPLFYLLHRKLPHYRALPIPLKAAGYVMIIGPLLSIQAERRTLEFEKTHWSDSGMLQMEQIAANEDARFNSLSTKEKVFDWASRHQYSIILGSWALSLAAAGAIVARDKYMTLPQKAVQARMWAQGLTIGVLIAAGVLTHQSRQEAATQGFRKSTTDHSWQTFLEQQAREEESRKMTLPVQATS